MFRCGSQGETAYSGRKAEGGPYLSGMLNTDGEGCFAFKDVLDALEQELEVEGSRESPTPVLYTAEEDVDEVECLDDGNLIVGVGFLKKDEDEGVEQLLVGEQTSCGLSHSLGILRHAPGLHFDEEAD
jgi:hypothetical protein